MTQRNPLAEVVLAAIVIGLMLALALPAMADDAVPIVPSSSDHRQANALYKEGVRLYNAGEYTSALDLFENAFHRYPDPRIQFSIATTLRQMGRTVDAANAYQRFVADPHAEAQLVADTQTVLKVLDATIGKVEIAFDGAPGEVQVEDSEWMPAGTAVVRVEPGSFIVRGRRDGFTAEATGRVAAGASATVTLRWIAHEQPKPRPAVIGQPQPAAKAVDAAPITEPPVSTTRRWLAGSLGSAGVALAGGALVLELGARSRISDAETACPSLRCGDPAYGHAQALLDQASSRRTTALVLGGAATVSVAVGAALWFTAHPSDGHLRIAPTGGDRAVGLVIDGRF